MDVVFISSRLLSKIALECIENNLNEEAFYIYDTRTKEPSLAIDVLINNIKHIKN